MAATDGKEIADERTWRVPQIADCRAVRFGHNAEIVYCLTADPQTCGFALRFGSSFLCLHPKREEIVLRTKT
jgi:hypothetical protein